MPVVAAPTVLHLGCGRVGRQIPEAADGRVVTLDADPRLDPDIVCTLGENVLPLESNSIDHAVAHHVLEHIGRPCETRSWFFFWEELYRVLRPGGTLRFESPLYSSVWAWADPGHVRALSPQSFAFLKQDSYRIPGSPITPYRVRCDFAPCAPYERLVDPTLVQYEEFSHFRGTLVAIKPLRPWWEDA